MSAPWAAVFNQDGVEVFPANEPGGYQFIPRVQPEVTSAGDPTLLLLKGGQGSLLQLGVQFTVDQALLDKIRRVLQDRQSVSSQIRLEQALLTVRRASLVLSMPAGDQALMETIPSGMPPHTALFRVPLTADQTKSLEQALAGQHGCFKVVYEFDLTDKTGAAVQIRGDATDALSILTPDSSEETLSAWVEEALSVGALKMSIEKWGSRPDDVVAEAMAAAKAKAVTLFRAMQGPRVNETMQRSNSLLSEARLEQPRTVAVTRDSDLAEWFAGGRKPSILTAPESPSARTDVQAAQGAVTVRLGFDEKDAPIAFVEVKGPQQQPALLRGPSWQPVSLRAPGRMTVTARYTTGEPSFVTEIEMSSGERSMKLEELGVARVVVDASARKSSGAKQLNVDVAYLRDGVTVDSWPVQFRYGDWTEQWFLITRASHLNGWLEYQWKETAADGSVNTGGPLKTDRPTIRIE